MARTKANIVQIPPITKQRARLDLHEALQGALKAAGNADWDKACELTMRAAPLARGLTTAPVKVRKLQELPTNDPRFSSSLERGLRIMALFDGDPQRVLGIADIADALDMSRSTTHRYVITLVGLGQLTQVQQRKYRAC